MNGSGRPVPAWEDASGWHDGLPGLARRRLLVQRMALALSVLLLLGLLAWLRLGGDPAGEGAGAELAPATLLAQAPPGVGRSSLAASDGEWAVAADGQLQPGRGLRQRFDHLLLRLGERDVAALRQELAQRAEAELGPQAQAQVLQLWDRYVALQQYRWQVGVDLQRTETWDAALAERQRVRRELLGSDWAQAFYGEDERRLRQWMAERTGRAPRPQSGASEPGLPGQTG